MERSQQDHQEHANLLKPHGVGQDHHQGLEAAGQGHGLPQRPH